MEHVGVSRHVVLSGCSGGGKSTLLAELARRGFATVPEPGRRIVEEELRGAGRALPWLGLAAFARRALDMARTDRAAVAAGSGSGSGSGSGWVFFDRGLVDAAAALEHATGEPAIADLAAEPRYHPIVVMTPPWPEIWRRDAERRHGLAEAVAEYERLLAAYRALDYEMAILPKVGVAERADVVLDRLRRAS